MSAWVDDIQRTYGCSHEEAQACVKAFEQMGATHAEDRGFFDQVDEWLGDFHEISVPEDFGGDWKNFAATASELVAKVETLELDQAFEQFSDDFLGWCSEDGTDAADYLGAPTPDEYKSLVRTFCWFDGYDDSKLERIVDDLLRNGYVLNETNVRVLGDYGQSTREELIEHRSVMVSQILDLEDRDQAIFTAGMDLEAIRSEAQFQWVRGSDSSADLLEKVSAS